MFERLILQQGQAVALTRRLVPAVLVRGLFADDRGDCLEPILTMEVYEFDTLCVAASHSYVLNAGAHHLAADGNKHNFIRITHRQCTADLTGLGRSLHSDDAFTTARLDALLVEPSTLANAVLTSNEQRSLLRNYGGSDKPVLRSKTNSAHTSRRTAH